MKEKMSQKKNITNLLVGVLIGCVISTSVTVYASDNFQSIQVVFNKVNLSVNGQKIVADNILYNGTTYVPIRAVANAFGKNVGWNADTNTASINDVGYVEPKKAESIMADDINYQTFMQMFDKGEIIHTLDGDDKPRDIIRYTYNGNLNDDGFINWIAPYKPNLKDYMMQTFNDTFANATNKTFVSFEKTKDNGQTMFFGLLTYDPLTQKFDIEIKNI